MTTKKLLISCIVALWTIAVFGFYLFYTLWDNVPEILAFIEKIKGILL